MQQGSSSRPRFAVTSRLSDPGRLESFHKVSVRSIQEHDLRKSFAVVAGKFQTWNTLYQPLSKTSRARPNQSTLHFSILLVFQSSRQYLSGMHASRLYYSFIHSPHSAPLKLIHLSSLYYCSSRPTEPPIAIHSTRPTYSSTCRQSFACSIARHPLPFVRYVLPPFLRSIQLPLDIESAPQAE